MYCVFHVANNQITCCAIFCFSDWTAVALWNRHQEDAACLASRDPQQDASMKRDMNNEHLVSLASIGERKSLGPLIWTMKKKLMPLLSWIQSCVYTYTTLSSSECW